MNYYIQGSPARAKEIKAAFEKLGCDTTGWTFNVEGGFYYTHDGRIDIACGKFIINLIKTHPDYKELELPAKPELKVGDWVVRKDGETFCSGNYAEQITSIVDDKKGKYIGLSSKSWLCGDAIRPWTIADAKDGDVLVYQDEIFIARMARGLSVNVAIDYDCCYDGNSFILDSFYSLTMEELKRVCPATKEQRELLFSKMKEAGYEWDAEKKELCKIKPQFKVGDKIRSKLTQITYTVNKIDVVNGRYNLDFCSILDFKAQDNFELVPTHYDIANFKPFDKVLVRDRNNDKWRCAWFSDYDKKLPYSFITTGTDYRQCIPFKGNEHLLGTADMCPEEYINW